MKRSSTLFLRCVILLFGIAVFALCIFVLPKGIMSGKAGPYLPILFGMYIPTIPFFIGLYNCFQLLQLIDKNKIFSVAAIRALRTIKYCAFVICTLYAIGMPYIFYVADQDDAPGVVFLGFLFIFSSLIVGTASAVFQNQLHKVIDIKLENDLTV